MTERSAGNLVRRIPQSRITDLESDLADRYTASEVDALLADKLDASEGPFIYQGTWNASTNSPTIPAAASGNKGQVYIVSTAGSTAIDGESDWKVKDWIVSDGTAWNKIDNTEPDTTSVLPISSNTTLTDEHPGRPRRVTASCTLTIADDRPENWLRTVLVDHGVTVSHDFGNNDVLDANGDVHDFGAETPEVAGPALYHIIATAAGTLEIRQ